MPQCVTTGSMCECTFGVAPSVLNAVPPGGALGDNMPVMTMDMIIPMVNILPFGMCDSLANPEVASATAAAMGVLTPMPCVPVVVDPWAPPSPTVNIAGMPAVVETSICECAWGGVIAVTEMAPSLIEG